MPIDTKLISELRRKSGAGIMDCKKALNESGDDINKAIEYLRKQGLQKADKKSSRMVGEGIITSYIHANGRIASLVEVHCETDFVAKTQEFIDFGKDLAMHIVAASPLYLDREDVPAEVLEKEKGIYKEQFLKEGKPEDMLDKIIEGKLSKYYADVCLLEQAFIKDEDRTIKDILTDKIATMGENIKISRFARFEI